MVSVEFVENHLQRLERDGYTIIENAISSEWRHELIDALLRVEAERGVGFAKTRFEGLSTVRIYNLLARDPMFWQVPLQPEVLAVAEALMDRELLLSSLSSITTAPGQDAQPLHEDTQQLPLPRPHVSVGVNAFWALTEFTELNGATRIIPGSHRNPQPPPYGASCETIPAEMPAGSVMVFDSQLWHAGGANRSQQRRFALSCYYCAGWVRQQENLLLGIPHSQAIQFPRRLQELCGYSVYKGQYGHLDNRDPIELLGRERARPMVWEASDRNRRRGDGEGDDVH